MSPLLAPLRDRYERALLRLDHWRNRGVTLFGRWRRWLPLASFLLGFGSFLLLERGEDFARWLPLVLLAGWGVILFEQALGRRLAGFLGERASAELPRFVLQGIHQESFFFSLPFVYASTTWDSGQLWYVIPVSLAALVSILDPVYFGWVARRRWLWLAFHCLALFVALSVAVPILGGLDAAPGLTIAAALTALIGYPSWRGFASLRHWPGVAGWLAAAALVALVAWTLRERVPPAPLRLMEGAITDQIVNDERRPSARMQDIDHRRLHRGGLYAFSAIRAPLGLEESVFHVWIHEGREIDRIPLRLRGGRREGFRTWSHKRAFPADPSGRWIVEVRTEYGQLIGRIRFRVD